MAPDTVIPITDAADPRVADFVRLTDVALRRLLDTERGLYLAESEPVVERALAAGHSMRALLVARSRQHVLVSLDIAPGTPCYVTEDALTQQITGFHLHRGVIASMHRPPLPRLSEVVDAARVIVVLEGLTNHTNVGAIFRSAAALGVDAVVVTPDCADPLYRRAVRVSMGAVFHVPWTQISPWPAAISDLQEAGFCVVALTPSPEATPLDRFAESAPERIALIVGTEGPGIHASTLRRVDHAVSIPMAGGIASLNVAAASAVALWELHGRTR